MDIPKIKMKSKHAAWLLGAAMVFAVPFIGQREGNILHSYWDEHGKVWTACEGVTVGVIPDHLYTEAECDQMNTATKLQYGAQVVNLSPENVSPKTMGAYISFAYNIGINGFASSSTLRLAKAGDIAGSCEAMLKWYKAGGHDCRLDKGLPRGCYGVWARRLDERKMCMEGIE